MIRKILLGTLFVGVIGVLIFGAVNRTTAKSGTPLAIGAQRQAVGEVQGDEPVPTPQPGYKGGGQGRNAGVERNSSGNAECDGSGSGYVWQTSPRNQGLNGQGSNNQGRGVGKGGSGEGLVSAVETIDGQITTVNADGMQVLGDKGETILIEGRAWMYLQEMGYTFNAGEKVLLQGFYEDGEFKVVQMVNNQSGEIYQVREQTGRPLWAGRGRGGRNGQS